MPAGGAAQTQQTPPKLTLTRSCDCVWRPKMAFSNHTRRGCNEPDAHRFTSPGTAARTDEAAAPGQVAIRQKAKLARVCSTLACFCEFDRKFRALLPRKICRCCQRPRAGRKRSKGRMRADWRKLTGEGRWAFPLSSFGQHRRAPTRKSALHRATKQRILWQWRASCHQGAGKTTGGHDDN